jgi:2'-5' RNA ligase
MRTFISLNLSDEIKEQILAVQIDVKAHIGKEQAKCVSWENMDKFHITVFFLGDVNAGLIERINVRLDKISYMGIGEIFFTSKIVSGFPNLRNPRVLIIDLKNPDAKAAHLYGEISNAIKKEGILAGQKFHPHITLGRLKHQKMIKAERLTEEIKFSLNFSVNKFFMMESVLNHTGAVHTENMNFDL